ncbi:MAG: cardiolipin synthase [Pseudomonadota bacterium]
MLEAFQQFWAELIALATLVLTIVLSVGVILRKRNERSALGWLGVILLSPPLGSLAFLLLGINRIRRRAQKTLNPDQMDLVDGREESGLPLQLTSGASPAGDRDLPRLARFVDQIVERPLVDGNQIDPLVDGGVAYPRMIEAIDSAERLVVLATYIFRRDDVGAAFIAALGRAKRRGVVVKVLIDGAGSHYSWPTVMQDLLDEGVDAARFLHSFWPWQMPYLNLRSHRKLLVIDGRIGFTGGMNITGKHAPKGDGNVHYRDVHFELKGPIVGQLLDVFEDDWHFTTGETPDAGIWLKDSSPAGAMHARAISDGPDDATDSLRWAMLGALTQADQRISIATPYFVPDQQLATALCLAALRGVEVDIVMPANNNLPFVKWASTSRMDELLVSGCRLWMSQPDFDHSKLFAVDGTWSLIGSANWDERSLRLNFELNVECYDSALAAEIHEMIDQRRAMSQPVTLEKLNARSLPVKFRDGVARLFSPYL